MQIDKIYVIALNPTQERIDDIVNRLRDLGISGIPYEIVNGFDGHNTPLPEGYNVYDGWAIPDGWNEWWKEPVKPGEVGCAISHINVWNQAIEEGYQRVLILEEDFKVERPLNELTDQELIGHQYSNWDLCYLGRFVFEDEVQEKITPNLVKPGNSYNAHAYMITREGAQKLVDGNLHSNIIPVDEYIPALYMGHRREDINAIFSKSMLAISTGTDWITQTSNANNTSIGHINYNGEEMNEPYFEILDDSNWEAWLDKYVDPTIRRHQWDLIVDEHRDTNIFEFPLFTQKFCDEAVALSEAKDNWTIDRHNAYPTNDVLLQDIGLNDIYNRVLREIVYPLCIHLWELEGPGYDDMYSENFLARYTMDRQSHLSLHHDFSNITMVVKLNDEFDGGGTWFPKYKILSNPKRVGTATLHPGLITHLHGARPITAGKRYITVSFMRKNEAGTL
jgi:GR25 family glycosyltransferase involved in LPS biosynthesis